LTQGTIRFNPRNELNMRNAFFVFLLLSCIARTSFGQDYDSTLKSGFEKIDKKDFQGAIKDFQVALKSKPGDLDATYGLIASNLFSDNIKEAQNLLSDALVINPNYAGFLLAQAIISIKKNELDEALTFLNKAAEQNNKAFEEQIILNRGSLRVKKDDFEGALADFNQLLTINPSNSGAYSNIGILYYKQEKYKEAITNFNLALEIDPSNTMALYNRGMCYFKQNLKTEACTDFHHSCRLNNTNACKMVITYCTKQSQ